MTNTKTASDMFYFHTCECLRVVLSVIKNVIIIKNEIAYRILMNIRNFRLCVCEFT